MAALQIPKDDVPAFVAIAGLGDESFQALLKAIKETQPLLNPKKYLSALTAKVPGLDQDDAFAITTALFSLYELKEKRGVSVADLTSALAEATKEIPKSVADFSNEKIAALKERLGLLLSLDDSLGIMMKAADISKEYERRFCKLRILSDIRPVFLNTPDKVPAAIIVHNLQIGFHDGTSGEHKEIYMSADDEDLLKLAKAIERAQKKSVALKSLLKTSKMTHIGV
jgi:hypothetical protein